MSLNLAHKGYDYQDIYSTYLLLTAFQKFKDFKFSVDKKEHSKDSFDDIIIFTSEFKLKYQIRYSDSSFLSYKDFEKAGNFSIRNFSDTYKFDHLPTYYILGTTKKLEFEKRYFKVVKGSNDLLPENVYATENNYFKKLCNINFLDSFIIVDELPKISKNLHGVGELETSIIQILKNGIGVGTYPNDSLSPESFSESIFLFIRTIRRGDISQPLSRNSLIEFFKLKGLQTDFGHIAQQFPLVADKQRLSFAPFQSTIISGCKNFRRILITGSPGSGKSHQFDSLFENLNKTKNIAAIRHYCFLESTDDLSLERITLKRLFGNLVWQLQTKFPEINDKLSRHYGADKQKVEEFIKLFSQVTSTRVVIMIDGLDHIERIANQNKLSPDILSVFIEELLDLKLPANCCLLISSQPIINLNKFEQKEGVKRFEIPPWSTLQIKEYLLKFGLPESLLLEKSNSQSQLDLITQLSEGNPLYLNYIAKELLKILHEGKSISALLEKLPQFNNDINRYYKHLLYSIDSSDKSVIETIALLDFSISKNQLTEIFPRIEEGRILNALQKMHPVLQDNFSVGGIRIYHESFRRFILEKAFKRKIPKKLLYQHIVGWLVSQGFIDSILSYNYLFIYLKRTGQYKEIFAKIDENFISDSIVHFQAIDSISKNITIAANAAAEKVNFPILIMLNELHRALATYSNLDFLQMEVAETYLLLRGPQKTSERLILNGKPILSLEEGFRLCHKIAIRGGVPPWSSYNLTKYKVTVDFNNLEHFFELEAAAFYKRIKGKSIKFSFNTLLKTINRNKDISNQDRTDLLVEQIFLQFESDKIFEVLTELFNKRLLPKSIVMTLTKFVRRNDDQKQLFKILKEYKTSLNSKDIHQLISIGIPFKPLLNSQKLINNFFIDWKTVYNFEYIFSKEKEVFDRWYHALFIIGKIQPKILMDLKSYIITDGWYRGWLTYLFDLVLALNEEEDTVRESKLLEALNLLCEFNDPFKGKPRACDLYSIRKTINHSFQKALESANTQESTKKLAEIFSEISRNTLATLKGTTMGPLTEEDISNIYIKSFENKSPQIKKILVEGIQAQFKKVVDSGRFYEVQTSEALKSARTLFAIGKVTKANNLFKKASQLACAYGMRKDTTLWEIMNPIPSLFGIDSNFGTNALVNTCNLPVKVAIHTDGKGTNWALVDWYNLLFESDIKLGIKFLTQEINKYYKNRNWQIEQICENLANRLTSKISPDLLAELYFSLKMGDFDRADFIPWLNLIDEFYKRKKPAQDYVDFVCNCLLRWEYTYTNTYPYVEVILKFFKLKKKYKFTVDQYLEKELKRKIENKEHKPFAPRDKHVGKKLFSETMDIRQANNIINEKDSSLFNNKNLVLFGTFLCNLIKDGRKEEAFSLLKNYAKKSYAAGPFRAIEEIGSSIEKAGFKNESAAAYAIAFFYSRDDSGWTSLGDKSSYSIVDKGLLASKKVFFLTIANEIAELLESPNYSYGVTQHMIEMLCYANKNSESKNSWTNAFNVINKRLPSMDLPWLKSPIFPKLSNTDSYENLIETLLKQRAKIKDKNIQQ